MADRLSFPLMTEHFRAFSFVDKIHGDETGERITGSYHIPAGVDRFPLSLVAESIGQLAAWSSMAAVGFEFRPVAGIAGQVEFAGDVAPGDTLELEATLVKADTEAVGYDGVAKVNGKVVVRLQDCLGPMVPLVEFDDPESLKERYRLLNSEGAMPGAFEGIPEFVAVKTGGIHQETSEGTFHIPNTAAFFGDHFPRRPVFPGTLLMNLNLGFTIDLAAEADDGASKWKPLSLSDVKLRSFMPPGEILELKATVEERDLDRVRVIVETRRGKRLTSSARVLLSRIV